MFVQTDPTPDATSEVSIMLPSDTEWQKQTEPSMLSALNRLGQDGWELIGTPAPQNGVFSYIDRSGNRIDKATPIAFHCFLKREVG